MDLNSSALVLQNKIEKKYLKLKHKIYRKICKKMRKGETSFVVIKPMFMDTEVYIHIMAKIIVDFQKLGIQHCTPYGEIRFVWGNLIK